MWSCEVDFRKKYVDDFVVRDLIKPMCKLNVLLFEPERTSKEPFSRTDLFGACRTFGILRLQRRRSALKKTLIVMLNALQRTPAIESNRTGTHQWSQENTSTLVKALFFNT